VNVGKETIGAQIALVADDRKMMGTILTVFWACVGIVVSESSVVRLFCHGHLVGEIIPEVWMMDHAGHLRGTVKREQVGELTILTPNLRPASIAE
jgi:hypothetical protein